MSSFPDSPAPHDPHSALYLDQLNPAQTQAVKHIDGPLLMLAGAGTGKTRALTTRIAHIIALNKAFPNQILAVTFTNKAAMELKQRIATLLHQPIEGMAWVGTFHAIANKLLRRHAELVGLNNGYTILATDDQLRVLKQTLSAHNIDEKRWPVRLLAYIIDEWKNRALLPNQIPTTEHSQFNGQAVRLYAAYQQRLQTLNAVDFGDLLLHTLTILQNHTDILATYQRRFRYILVDEYQDTNIAQYLWLRLLASAHHNICCVGDDDQSIYGWRGAEVGNILRFEKDFPNAAVIRLEQNYRSSGHILAAASAIIAHNTKRLGKTLWTDKGVGEKVRLLNFTDGAVEARWISEDINTLGLGSSDLPAIELNGIAVLVRTVRQMRAFEERFLEIGMPYRVIGGARFYERLEIRDALAYVQLALAPDSDLAFERIINTPKRGLGKATLQNMQKTAHANGVSLTSAAHIMLQQGIVKGKAGAALTEFLGLLALWHSAAKAITTNRSDAVSAPATDLLDALAAKPPPAAAAPTTPMRTAAADLAARILDESGYTAFWQNEKTPEAPGRLENLKELVAVIGEFDTLDAFLEHVSLIMDNNQDSNQDKVSIMTMHAAKGLEFDAVFLPGWEEGLFPSKRSVDEDGIKGLEEERRLAYVAITRGRQLCTISFASNRQNFGQWDSAPPSRFVDELPKDNVQIVAVKNPYQRVRVVGGGQYDTITPQAPLNSYTSPGWQRLQKNTGSRTVVLNKAVTENKTPNMSCGMRVFHQKFGYGIIQGVEQDKAWVDFEQAGVKQIITRFLFAAAAAHNES